MLYNKEVNIQSTNKPESIYKNYEMINKKWHYTCMFVNLVNQSNTGMCDID